MSMNMGPKALPNNAAKKDFVAGAAAANPPAQKAPLRAVPANEPAAAEPPAAEAEEVEARVPGKRRQKPPVKPMTVRVPASWKRLIEETADANGLDENGLLNLYIGMGLGVSTLSADAKEGLRASAEAIQSLRARKD